MSEREPITASLGAWARLGPWEQLRRWSPPHPVSNELWRARAGEVELVVKRIVRPAALYGGADAVERLALVGRATLALASAGLPVEKLLPTDAGEPLFEEADGAVVRVYRLEPGEVGREDDGAIALAARGLERIHVEGAAVLASADRTALAALPTPFPLAETSLIADELRTHAARRGWHEIVAAWPTVEAALAAWVPARGGPSGLLHNDAHPRNLLVSETQAVWIDLDNCTWGSVSRCTAFAVLRFAFSSPSAAREPARLRHVTEAWLAQAPSVGARALRAAMIEIELEKTLRILERSRQTGAYEHFVPNLTRIHVPNLALLLRTDFADLAPPA
ncbi:MAG: phosphotransferase [Sandaracinus sp.]